MRLFKLGLTAMVVAVIILGPPSPAGADARSGTATLPEDVAAVPEYVVGHHKSHAPVIRVFKDSDAWFGENRDGAALNALGKIPADDWFVHPIADCQDGMPSGTAVVLFTSNGMGLPTASAAQSSAACQGSLADFLAGAGILIVDMGDNDTSGGFMAPGSEGTPSLVFPEPCADATLAPAAAGPDGVLGTQDDHPLVRGPDGIAGTSDDLTDSNIDMVDACFVAHGNLEDGLTLPADATVLMTATFSGVQKPILAEYCLGGGRVVVDTVTKEFVAHQPTGLGPSFLLTNLLSYALGPAAACAVEVAIDIKPGSDANPIKLSSKGVVPVAILSTDAFDATTVDAGTVCFGDAEDPSQRDCTEEHGKGHVEDVNGDRLPDLVLHYETSQTGIDPDDTQACLAGKTSDGASIEGCDAVTPI